MIPDLPAVNGPEVSKWIGSSVWSRDMGRDECGGFLFTCNGVPG